MKNMMLNVPTFAFIVGTRALLGAGAGLLLANRLGSTRRQKLGATLVAIGVGTTLPAVLALRRGPRRDGSSNAMGYDEGLKGVSRFARKGDDEY